MTKPLHKINLTLLKRLVSELEVILLNADNIITNTIPNSIEWIVEMNKALGLTSGVMQESMMLVGDIQATMQDAAGGLSPHQKDVVNNLFSKMKGSSGIN